MTRDDNLSELSTHYNIIISNLQAAKNAAKALSWNGSVDLIDEAIAAFQRHLRHVEQQRQKPGLRFTIETSNMRTSVDPLVYWFDGQDYEHALSLVAKRLKWLAGSKPFSIDNIKVEKLNIPPEDIQVLE